MPMTDVELAAYLHLTEKEAEILLPRMKPERRAVYDRMKEFGRPMRHAGDGFGPLNLKLGAHRDAKTRLHIKLRHAATVAGYKRGKIGARKKLPISLPPLPWNLDQ